MTNLCKIQESLSVIDTEILLVRNDLREGKVIQAYEKVEEIRKDLKRIYDVVKTEVANNDY